MRAYRRSDELVDDGMTLWEMWRDVASEIYYGAFLIGGGVPEMDNAEAIQIMTEEFYRTSEENRVYRPDTFWRVPFREQYNRIQPSNSYTRGDLCLWENTTWEEIETHLVDVMCALDDPRTTWVPSRWELYYLEGNVIRGILYAIAHIPCEEERDEEVFEDGDSD